MLFRGRRSIGRKEVARLLGYVTTNQIARYELGTRIPTFGHALKLSLIYEKPIHVLFEPYLEQCMKEIRIRNNAAGLKIDVRDFAKEGVCTKTDFCSFEQMLRTDRVSPTHLANVARHSIELVRLRAQKLGHY